MRLRRPTTKTTVRLTAVLLTVGITTGLYLHNDYSYQIQEKQYSINPAALQNQDRPTAADSQQILHGLQQPLLQQLPYQDGVIFVDTTDASDHLGIQYTGSLPVAQAEYQQLLGTYGDNGLSYTTTFTQVKQLPAVDAKD